MGDWTRRQFLGAGAAALGLAAVGTGRWSAVAGAAPKGQGTRNLLRIPPGTAATSTLTAAPGRIDLGGGRATDALVYNGWLPGPTFDVRRGTSVAATLRNRLGDMTTIHWHGLVVPTAADGQPLEAVEAGADRLYQFAVDQRASLNLYHPHPHEVTASQVYFGLAGAFLVRDGEEDALGLPGGSYEVPLIVRDASFDSAGNLSYGGTMSGFQGRVPLVNGTLSPYLPVVAGVYRLRVVNAATARIFRLALSDGAAFTLIGNDGGLLPAPVTLTSVDLAPAERADILVDLGRLAGNTSVRLRCLLAGWDLLELRRVSGTGVAFTAPPTLSVIAPLGPPVGSPRLFSFDGMNRINGRVYDPARIDFTVPAGRVETWRFRTSGNAPHPVHVHGASFQVVARTGGRGRLFPWEAGWKDTVLLNDGETVDVKVRFEDWQRGERYLIHCHKLEHEDAGMMAAFEVA